MPANQHTTCPTSPLQWFYAQFDQLTLDAAFTLVGSMKANQSKVTDVAAHISVNQGWYADDDTGDITGNKKLGMLVAMCM